MLKAVSGRGHVWDQIMLSWWQTFCVRNIQCSGMCHCIVTWVVLVVSKGGSVCIFRGWRSSEISGTTNWVTQCDVPEQLNLATSLWEHIFMFSDFLFWKSCHLWDCWKMWSHKPQMASQYGTCVLCAWSAKDTCTYKCPSLWLHTCTQVHTHTDRSVILTVFPQQQWFTNAPQCYVIRTVPVLCLCCRYTNSGSDHHSVTQCSLEVMSEEWDNILSGIV
jgi:hypothetical protein